MGQDISRRRSPDASRRRAYDLAAAPRDRARPEVARPETAPPGRPLGGRSARRLDARIGYDHALRFFRVAGSAERPRENPKARTLYPRLAERGWRLADLPPWSE